MKKTLTVLLVTAVLLLAAVPALAGDVFTFVNKNPSLLEGETVQMVLERSGKPAGEGTVTYTSSNQKVATVSGDGVVTAVSRGNSVIAATLKTGNRTWRVQTTVTVLRRVTNVTLNTTQMQVYDPEDPFLAGVLQDDPTTNVIVLTVGREVRLAATVTPQDASDKVARFSSSDEGIASVRGNALRGMQGGECELHIESRQDPDVYEDYHVLVVRPVTKVEIVAEKRSVHVGEQLALGAVCSPENATIRSVTWSSQKPSAAFVDSDGVVTGLQRGNVSIIAKAADGSGRSANVVIKVTQKAEELTLKEDAKIVNTGRTVNLAALVKPATTDDKTVTWTSSDERIATVNRGGVVTGVRAGECTVTATSNSNPELSASARITVHQLVTSIEFNRTSLTFPVKTTQQVNWNVFPDDATDPTVKLTSSNKNVATVDDNGVIRGISRGTANIIATAQDGSGRRGSMKVTITQPVEGVSIQYGLYHVQLGKTMRVKAVLQPSNANDTRVNWRTDDTYVATVKDNNNNYGTVSGRHRGECTLTGITVDGGFRASTEIRVDDFNHAVDIDDVWINDDRIRMIMRNRSEFGIKSVFFTVWCYDSYGDPAVCHKDGVSTSVTGEYPANLLPSETTVSSKFKIKNFVAPEDFYGIKVQITGWKDFEGYTRTIPEDDRPTRSWDASMNRW